MQDIKIAYDLFAGAGGASLGLTWAGFSTLGFELKPDPCETQALNGLLAVQKDLREIDWSLYETPDLLWASPPCQPFSNGGLRIGPDDGRNLMPEFLRCVEALRPNIVMMENVKGITFPNNKQYLQNCIETLEQYDYTVEWKIFNCADFGVPQKRLRLILVARNDGKVISWPLQTHAKDPFPHELPWVTMFDALGWGMTCKPYPTLAAARESGGPDKEKVGGGGARKSLYVEMASGRWVNCPNYSHITYDGKPEIRISFEETAILQGFPNDFKFGGKSYRSKYRQLCNAIPPLFVKKLVESVDSA